MNVTVNVRMHSAEFIDPRQNAKKFYATFVVTSRHGTGYFFHYGRIGTDGQTTVYVSSDRAHWEAADKMTSKLREGYIPEAPVEFLYDVSSSFTGSKAELKALASYGRQQLLSSGARAPGAPAAMPEPEPAPPATPVLSTADRLAAFHERALAAMGLAVTDPDAAYVELAILREEWSTLQAQMERAESYLDTLDQLLMGAPA